MFPLDPDSYWEPEKYGPNVHHNNTNSHVIETQKGRAPSKVVGVSLPGTVSCVVNVPQSVEGSKGLIELQEMIQVQAQEIHKLKELLVEVDGEEVIIKNNPP